MQAFTITLPNQAPLTITPPNQAPVEITPPLPFRFERDRYPTRARAKAGIYAALAVSVAREWKSGNHTITARDEWGDPLPHVVTAQSLLRAAQFFDPDFDTGHGAFIDADLMRDPNDEQRAHLDRLAADQQNFMAFALGLPIEGGTPSDAQRDEAMFQFILALLSREPAALCDLADPVPDEALPELFATTTLADLPQDALTGATLFAVACLGADTTNALFEDFGYPGTRRGEARQVLGQLLKARWARAAATLHDDLSACERLRRAAGLARIYAWERAKALIAMRSTDATPAERTAARALAGAAGDASRHKRRQVAAIERIMMENANDQRLDGLPVPTAH